MLKDNSTYKRNILICIIISELLVISAFVFSPKKLYSDREILFEEPVLLLNDIPPTVQRSLKPALPPQTPSIIIPGEIDVFEILDDVAIVDGTSDKAEDYAVGPTGKSNTHFSSSAPRLLYEVVPEKNDYHGSLQISLKINESGKVIDHRILYNSLNCNDCLDGLIEAAYRSKWEPAAVNGRNENYWVVKSYSFN